jgi:hypothetical protein
MTRRPGRGHDVAEASAPSRQPGALSAAEKPNFTITPTASESIKKLGAW